MKKFKSKKEIKQDPKTEGISFYLSVEELRMLDYCVKKFKHKNRSSYIRRLVMTDVLSQLFESYPTLFDQETAISIAEDEKKLADGDCSQEGV